MRAMIFGCGYLGQRVASRWLEAGHSVSAITRSPAKADEFHAAGIAPFFGDVTEPDSLRSLPSADVVLYAVGYDRASGLDRRTVVVEGLRNALGALREKCDRLVVISTTSVYGQSDGEWIDEESPTEPRTEAGRLALEAERLLVPLSAVCTPHSIILRLAGLYGPGRFLRRIDQLRAREPIAGDGDSWLNLIHVEDAATAVMLAVERVLVLPSLSGERSEVRKAGTATPVYLVSDDRPVRRRDYYGKLAELTGSPPPLFDPSTESRSAGLGKRYRNERAKRELRLRLEYPTFQTGLHKELADSGTHESTPAAQSSRGADHAPRNAGPAG